jgi:hypothetical protein
MLGLSKTGGFPGGSGKDSAASEKKESGMVEPETKPLRLIQLTRDSILRRS